MARPLIPSIAIRISIRCQQNASRMNTANSSTTSDAVRKPEVAAAEAIAHAKSPGQLEGIRERLGSLAGGEREGGTE